MNRFKWGAALLVVLVGILGVGWLVGVAEEVPGETAGAVGDETLSPQQAVRPDTPVTVVQSAPPDTLPARLAVSDWPFAELPLVIKGGLPTPEVSVRYSPSQSLYEHALVRPVRSQPVVAAQGVSPLWLLGPLAAGAGVGSADVGPTRVPEPSLLLLLSTGLLFLGIRAIRRA